MDENKKNERPEDTGNDLSLDEILADIEAERRQAAPNDRQAPAKAAVQAAAPAAKPAADPAVHSGQTGRSGASAAPDFPRAAEPAPVHDAVHDAAHGAARKPSGAPYLGKKIAEVPLDPEAEKAGEAKRPGERKKDKKSRGLLGRRKKRIPEPDEEDPYYGLQLKSLEEYRKDYEKTLSFQAITDEDLAAHAAQDGEEEGAEFRYLFTKAEIRDPNEESELAKRFEEIRAARKRRIQQAIQETGSLQTDIFSLVKDEMNLTEEELRTLQKKHGRKAGRRAEKPQETPELLLEAADFPVRQSPEESPPELEQQAAPKRAPEGPAIVPTPKPVPEPGGVPGPIVPPEPTGPAEPVSPIPMPTAMPVADPITTPITGQATGQTAGQAAGQEGVPAIESLWNTPDTPEKIPAEGLQPAPGESVPPVVPAAPVPSCHPAEPAPAVVPQPSDTAPPAAVQAPEPTQEEPPVPVKEPAPAVQPASEPGQAADPAPRTDPEAPGTAKPPIRLNQSAEDPFTLYRARNARVHTIDVNILPTALEREAKQYPKPAHLPEKKAVPVAAPVEQTEQDGLPPAVIARLTGETSAPAGTPCKREEAAAGTPDPVDMPAPARQPSPKPAAPAAKPAEPPRAAQKPAQADARPAPARVLHSIDGDNAEPTAPVRINRALSDAKVPDLPEARAGDMPAEAGQAEPPHKQRKRGRFRVLADEEMDNRADEELPQPEEEIDDYRDPADAPSILHSIGAWKRELLLRMLVSALCVLLLGAVGFLGEFSLFSASGQPVLPVQTYLILNVIFLMIAILFNGQTLLNGLKGLFFLRANSDSGVAVAALVAEVHALVLAFVPERVTDSSLHLYVLPAALALLLNTAGKLVQVRRVGRNFHFVSSPEAKMSVQIFDDHNTALRMGRDCVPGVPVIAYQKKAHFLRNFLRLSFEFDPSDQNSQLIAPLGVIASLVLCIAAFLLSGDALAALTALTVSCCVCVPFTNTLSVNLPLKALDKLSARCGAMLCGYPAVEKFSRVNAVMLDARDLFPRGTLVLNGIKTFGGQRIDEAIVDATGLMCAVGGPLSDLFSQIVQNRREILPKVENPLYEDGMGVVGWVSGRRILVGNRLLMQSYSIEPPSADYEETYRMGGRQLLYLAADGELVAMFLISYISDRRRAAELHRMEDNGLSLIVRTCDPSITPAFLAGCFQLDESSIAVLPDSLGKVYEGLTAEPDGRADALMATKGRPTAMMRMITACVRQRANISIAVALQAIAVVLGFLLAAFLTCYSGLPRLTTLFLVLYEVLWSIAILALPRLRKP